MLGNLVVTVLNQNPVSHAKIRCAFHMGRSPRKFPTWCRCAWYTHWNDQRCAIIYYIIAEAYFFLFLSVLALSFVSQTCFSPNLPPAPPPTWCDSGDCHQTSDGLMSHPRNLWHPAQGGRWQVPWRISWEMGITKRHVWVLNQILGLDELVTHLNTLRTHILYIQDAFLKVYWAWTDVIWAVYRWIAFAWSVDASLPMCSFYPVGSISFLLCRSFDFSSFGHSSKHGSGSHPTAATSSWM